MMKNKVALYIWDTV